MNIFLNKVLHNRFKTLIIQINFHNLKIKNNNIKTRLQYNLI